LLLGLSGVGLFLLKNSKRLRAIVFYSSLSLKNIEQATHIYIKGEEGE
jgi:hypothetical protein